MFDLHGRTALVTGSNRGIGRAILLALAEHGADVVLHCRMPNQQAQEVLAKAKGMGVRSFGVYADLEDPRAAGLIHEQTEALGLSIDMLILNASIQIRADWLNITDEDYDAQMNVNFRSSLKLAQKYVPGMRARGFGRLITIGSVQQKKPHEAMMVYAASKTALMGMVTSLATLLAPDGVTVNNIAPGAIYTDRNAEALADKDYEQRVRSQIPMGFIGEPVDVAGTAVLLCANEGRYITGQDIYVDGGKSL